ncbi:flagellar hook-associated protein FlgL [Oceanirhabdus sp. W0125-5]|uniref:flagellar hook-associated protein FlgL n=1 Tax=Oceanirhabdus sp. W0125-5 TaxID=2999116 RepID=UPI0022F2B201|nr:flagellar hook-associated protein FlgL [Oceanirhabdus sp. W0125-5]WBW95471.1 flagellar hook-associated protein FlgL [Oceanirhabdus sp. W0125-5]
MRVTNKMMSNNFLRDLNYNLKNMQRIQTQLTTGKEFKRPSDDPFKVARSMQLYSDIDTNKQYNENVKDAINWLDTTDTALGQANNVFQRIHELMISAGNGGYSDNERKAIKDEINERVSEFSQILNTSFDGKFIFGGTRGTVKPTDAILNSDGNTDLKYYSDININATDQEKKMIDSKLNIEISSGVTIGYNVNAVEILEFKNLNGEDKNVINIMKSLANHLDGKASDGSGATDPDALDKLLSDDLTDVKNILENLTKLRSRVGAMQNRMESAKVRNEEENFNIKEILSKTEDIDIAEKTMEYATMQTVYLASLQTSAKVIQPSLIDYLR